MRLENKVALISGGARGQGEVEAKLFAKEGARVVIGDILEDEGRRVEAEINELGGECVFVTLDVTKEEEWERAVATAAERFGKLDILVNNAGIFKLGTVEDTTPELWDEIMDINSKGVFLGTKCAIPEMRKAGGGSIVNISSVAGLIGDAVLGGLRRLQGVRAVADQGDGNDLRQGRDKGQLGPSRGHRDADDGPEPAEQRGDTAAVHRAAPAGEGRAAGGRGLRGAVPGIRRVFVHDGQRAGD